MEPQSPPAGYEPPQDIRLIVPLATGDTSYYNLISFGSSGELETTAVVWQVLDTITVDSISWYQTNGFGGYIYDDPLVRVDSTSYVNYFCYFCVSGTEAMGSPWCPFYFLRAPITVGHEWKIAPWDTTGMISFGSLRITNTDAAVSISGETYEHAIVVEFKDDLFGRYIVFVPGIGIVKEHYGIVIDSGSWIELTSRNELQAKNNEPAQ